MKTRDQKIDVTSIQYNRNGIGGQGYYKVEFLWSGTASEPPHSLVGFVFPGSGSVAVIELFDPERQWRGDEFEKALRKAVTDHELAETRYCYTAVADGLHIGGYLVARVVEDIAGYHPVQDGFSSEKEAAKVARDLNAAADVTEERAVAIVLSSMKAQNVGSSDLLTRKGGRS